MTLDQSSIVIIGAHGQLGLALQQRFPRALAIDRDNLDIADHQAVTSFDWSKVKVIINAAAMTDVDGAETPDGRRLAWQINAVGVANLVAVATKIKATFVHYSTDYVFDGQHAPHAEDEPLSPLGAYGQSKAAGEIALSLHPHHYLLRTSWLIGEGKNFVRTMIGLAEKGVSPQVVSDQTGRPTFVSQLVDATVHLLETQAPFGAYNVSNAGPVVSWAKFARTTFKLGHFPVTVTDTTTEQYLINKPTAAPRPLHSEFKLDKIAATGLQLRDWSDDLASYLGQN